MHRFTNRIRFAPSARVVAGLAALLTAGACASLPPAPLSSLDAARASIADAEQSGARQYAGAELDEARQKFVMAENAVKVESMIEAERLP